MGVPGLWKELQGDGKECALARLAELVSNDTTSSPSSSAPTSPRSLRLGIDVSSWMFHAQKSIGGHNPHLRSFFWRLCRLLAIPYVLPVFVFDGPFRPKEKRGRVVHNYRESTLSRDLRELIIAFGFIVFDALGEAEAELARLNASGFLDAILSDDVDCFVFGAKLVVRNWGQELSGTKARSDFVAERSASAEASSSNGEEPSNSQLQRSEFSASDRLALGKNLLTYYKSSDIEKGGLSKNGMIMVAALSGGDYDVQGLPRCGVKISIALAKAGYADILVEGLLKHCNPPTRDSSSSHRLTAPQPKESWPTFLAEWLASVRQELSTNASGHLGRRFKKLAESSGFAELLSTKASLSVLGNYVWPLTTEVTPDFSFGGTDLATIAEICQRMFRWTAALALQTFRNQLWVGCATRELMGNEIRGLCRKAATQTVNGPKTKSKSKNKEDKQNSSNISTFFARKAQPITVAAAATLSSNSDESKAWSPLVISVSGERQLGSTGNVKEIRLLCDIRGYVELAKERLDFSISFVEQSEMDAPPSSQLVSTPSPRKRRAFADPDEELRMCIAEGVVVRNNLAVEKLNEYRSSQGGGFKQKTLESKSRSTTDQGRIDSFFTAKKSSAPISTSKKGSKTSPMKSSVPTQTISRSSSSSSLSRSPSPLPLSYRKGVREAESPVQEKRSPANVLQETLAEQTVDGRNDKKQQVVVRPVWNAEILNISSDEGEGIDDSGDASLPSFHFPTTKNTTNLQCPSSDTSVEYVMTKTSPVKGGANTLNQAVEVIDDSDED